VKRANTAHIELYYSSSPERDTSCLASNPLTTCGAPDIVTESTSWPSWTRRCPRRLPHLFGIESLGTCFQTCRATSRRSGARWLPANMRRTSRSITKACTDRHQRGQKIDSSKSFPASSSYITLKHSRCILSLPKFAQSILDLICEATGLKGSIYLGGPEPARGGRLQLFRYVTHSV